MDEWMIIEESDKERRRERKREQKRVWKLEGEWRVRG